MRHPVVAIVKYADPYESVARALELSDGLAGLRPGDKILIKPNLVEWEFELPYPPWGVVTTSAVMGALVRILAERGYRNLTIGEGTPLPHAKGKGRKVFGVLGYETLRDRYGVQLVDFDEETFEDVDLGDLTLSLARRALEADKIITVPALKTHGVCQVSLGIKNLKGCISRKSKKFCHHPERNLSHTFPHLLQRLPVALNLIDGVYALERGPTHNGRAYRRDLLVASTDVYAGDVVGAKLIGHEVVDVPHLQYFGQKEGRLADVDHIDVRGESMEENKVRLEWDTPWREDNSGPTAFDKLGIAGLSFRKPDTTVCTNCACVMAPSLVMLMSAYNNETSGTIEVITGKKTVAREGFDKTVLLGRCATALNKDNAGIKQRIELNTCPPDMHKLAEAMREVGVNCDYAVYEQFRQKAFNRYKESDGFTLSMYSVASDGPSAGAETQTATR
ncbi:MAG: DUF362 domain-containing protein [Deltaproteobacteria bacterium]|nr:DUF362 domain-containing protein [Deltaproteobacteria bacterium]